MAKRDESTIENRVYLFRDLAAAWLSNEPGLLGSADPDARARALRALGDLAWASCVVADGEELEPGQVAELIASRVPPSPKASRARKR